MLDTSILLNIRAVLNIVLFFVLLTGAVALFLQQRNGITRALATSAMIGALYVGVVIAISFIDVCSPELTIARNVILLLWNIITGCLIVAVFWLGYKLLNQHD